ncbi:MAG: FRG domain-containing protein [Coxiellaceae bacterium]|nr:FRG domain-containing protein [Coxiellaceae bacterium]
MADIKKDLLDGRKNFITLDSFFNEIDRLRQFGFIFRGQSDSDFLLQPKVFRKKDLHKIEELFGNLAKNCVNWMKSDSYKDIVKMIRYAEDAIHYPDVVIIYKITMFKMQYNYFLSKHVERYPSKFDDVTRKMYEMKKPEYWLKEETFLCCFRHELDSSTTLISLDDKILKNGMTCEEMAGYDESLPQHYDTPTAALDWSYDPRVALYFSIEDLTASSFSIYAYKEIANNRYNPIEVMYSNPGCMNERIIKQKGLFTRFRYACSYYYSHQEWPAIDFYVKSHRKGNFELIKFDLPLSYKNDIKNLLEKNGITKKSLGFAEEVNDAFARECVIL